MSERIEGSDGDRCIVPPDDRRCAATAARTGQRCLKWAIFGGRVCPTHGGSIGRVKAAAARRVAEAEAMAVLEKFTPNGDGPVDVAAELRRLVARMTALSDLATSRLASLTAEQWAAFSPRTQADVTVFQQWCRDLGHLLTDLARLGVLERMAEAQAKIHREDALRLRGAVIGALAELGVNVHDPAVQAVVTAHFQQLVAEIDDG